MATLASLVAAPANTVSATFSSASPFAICCYDGAVQLETKFPDSAIWLLAAELHDYNVVSVTHKARTMVWVNPESATLQYRLVAMESGTDAEART